MVAAVAAILYDASGTRIGSGVLFPSVINDIEFAASTWLSESSSDTRWRKKKQRMLPRILRINLDVLAKFRTIVGVMVFLANFKNLASRERPEVPKPRLQCTFAWL